MTSNSSQRTNRLLSRKDAVIFLTELGLTISPQTLARFFCESNGPMCTRVGIRAMYRECDLLDYFRLQCCAPRQSEGARSRWRMKAPGHRAQANSSRALNVAGVQEAR
jgi:hypothetical protein